MNEVSSVSFGFVNQQSDEGDAYQRKINRIESIKSLVNSEMASQKEGYQHPTIARQQQ